MTSVFLSGSRRITRLPATVVERIHAMIEGELDILIGDANGADRLMQVLLADLGYRRVMIYHSGDVVRNNVGGWDSVGVQVEAGIEGRAFFARKDRKMAELADFGFIVWDGKSAGSIANASEMTRLGKKCVMYVAPRHGFAVAREPRDVEQLLQSVADIEDHSKHAADGRAQRSFRF